MKRLKPRFFYIRDTNGRPVVTVAYCDAKVNTIVDGQEGEIDVIAFGVATCSKEDNFDREFGRLLATRRITAPSYHTEKKRNAVQGGYVIKEDDRPRTRIMEEIVNRHGCFSAAAKALCAMWLEDFQIPE